MKVLIMVLSCMKHPYDKMYQAQLETWDSVKVDNVETVYYWGEEYKLMHVPFKKSLSEVWDKDWDVIFRTNSSSYVDKQLLYDYIKDKPKENLWIGNQDAYCSGAGFFISRDLAEVLKNDLHERRYFAEDVLIYETLKSRGFEIKPGQRKTYGLDNDLNSTYHIRCKHDHNMILAVDAFHNIFKDKNKNKN